MKQKSLIQKIKDFFSRRKTENEVNEKIAEMAMEKDDREIAEQMLKQEQRKKQKLF